ncbi:MAG: succinylglutamate desuccinylase [Planctomycetota bacterium]|jgi:succinylglutamate desuccinylase
MLPMHDWARNRGICDLDTRRPGPLLLCTAGVHGNEPAGGEALVRIMKDFTAKDFQRGRLLGLTGNMASLAMGERYQVHDLNRIWTKERATRLMADPKSAMTPEEVEMAALLPIIHHAMDQCEGEVFFLDLHSTSGRGAPFACCMEVTHHRQFMEGFSIPMILGLRPRMAGTLMDYLAGFGHSAIGVEGGQNEDADTVRCHEAVIRVAINSVGLTDEGQDKKVEESINLLKRRSEGLPPYLEVKHRYVVNDGDGFVMGPGFENFSQIKAGQVVAHDRNGTIVAKEEGIMLFPRYQAEGADGFFLAQPTTLS